MAQKKSKMQEIRCAAVGYGGAFNMGRHHFNAMLETKVMRPVAVCDLDEARLAVAKQEFPEVETYTTLGQMLAKSEADLVVVILPHHLHAWASLKCLNAGKHVVVEKPMCLTVKEATAMIQAAKRNKVMLSVYHNRRWDGDYLTLRELVGKGIIGHVFHLEAYGGGYGHPGHWWRSDKRISGGAFYDWGAHFVDWTLGIMDRKMVSVTGYFHKLVWKDVTNEEHVEGIIRFEDGAVANVQLSHLAMAGKPRWHILGTQGAIVDQGGSFKVYTQVNGYHAEIDVKYRPSQHQEYYKNIAEHLLHQKPLAVTPESARRVIEVIEYAERSSKLGKTLPVPYA